MTTHPRLSALRAAIAACFLAGPALADGTDVGAVSTTFRLLGANDRIQVTRYDDPKVAGVSCYLSHAATGGVKGSLGLATDPSRFGLACHRTGPVTPAGALPDSEVVFGERTSLFSKQLRVSRIVDREKHVLVYLAWSTLSLSTGGSPYNAIAVVPMEAR